MSLQIPDTAFLSSITGDELVITKDRRAYTDRSLLRYPGGKTRGVEVITQYFPEISEMASPFFGGGSIELYMAAKGVKIYGYDIFTPLVEFWQCVIKNPIKLAEKVADFLPLSKETFYELQQHQACARTKLERAAIFYVLNRSSFSGSTLSGGMSPGHPRFTQSSIERLRTFFNPLFSVESLDFKQSIKAHKNCFLYLDPPYLIRSALYGKKGNVHKDFDHEGLFKALLKRDNWILSYNDCAEIRTMYKSYNILTPVWKYGMSNDKRSKEVLIFSRDIKPIAYADTGTVR